MGCLLANKGDWEGAIKAFQEALRIQPNLVQAQKSLNDVARILTDSADPRVRDPRTAVALARQLVKQLPKNANYWSTLGVAYYRAGDWKAAAVALEKSRELRKGEGNFDWFFLAMAHWRLDNKDQARRWYDRAAAWLEKHPKVERVHYPGLKSHPQHALAKRQMHAFGGMVTAILKGTLADSRRFLERCQIFALTESLGGVESLIEHPAIMTHASLPAETRAKLGIGDGLVRLSVGIEDLDDQIADLAAALG